MIIENLTKDECKYYLYQYVRLDTESIFYVGIGTKPNNWNPFKRAKELSSHNIFCKRIASKGNMKIMIIDENDNYEYIKNRECELIKKYGKINNNVGLLANITDGGEGTKGAAPCNRKKIYVYDKNGLYIKEFISIRAASKELHVHERSISRNSRKEEGLVGEYQFRFYKLSNITPSLSKTEKISIVRSRAVMQIDYEGKLCFEWKSASAAAFSLKVDPSAIIMCCRGNRKTAYGYKWQYKEYKENEFKACLDLTYKGKRKPVLQLTKENDELDTWESVAEASKVLKINKSHIADCARGIKPSAGGFKWKYL